jgi:hypothetical protein
MEGQKVRSSGVGPLRISQILLLRIIIYLVPFVLCSPTPKMEAVGFLEMLITIYQTTR